MDSRGHAKLADFGLSEASFGNKLKLKLNKEDLFTEKPNFCNEIK